MTREQALNYLKSSGFSKEQIQAIVEALEQEPKTGHWIEQDNWEDIYYECSECGEAFSLMDGTPTENMYNFCPNCGCRMIEPQESEDRE